MLALRHRLSCAIWGHVVDNATFRRSTEAGRRCRCGQRYLKEDGTLTHVRHTLSCFLRHHTYVRLADRDGAHEYVCVKCGHPLVYPAGTDPFTERGQFTKKVRYLCGLFGHRVQAVAARDGFTEYACHCGHSFLVRGTSSPGTPLHRRSRRPRAPLRSGGSLASLARSSAEASPGQRKIRHPLRCFFRAHRIRFVTRREGYAEYVCEDCGHPFCFVDSTVRTAGRPEAATAVMVPSVMPTAPLPASASSRDAA